MSRRPRKASFTGELAFGLLLALVAGAVGLTLSLVWPLGTVIRVIVAGIGLACVLRTLARADEPTGRVALAVAWTLAAAAIWLTGTGLALYVALHVAMVWLVRSLYTYTRITEAVLDLGLTALAASFAVWALVRTDGFFLAVWCFVLLQAMHVAIPGIVTRLFAPRTPAPRVQTTDQHFTAALAAADEALHRLAARRR